MRRACFYGHCKGKRIVRVLYSVCVCMCTVGLCVYRVNCRHESGNSLSIDCRHACQLRMSAVDKSTILGLYLGSVWVRVKVMVRVSVIVLGLMSAVGMKCRTVHACVYVLTCFSWRFLLTKTLCEFCVSS